MLQLKIQIRGRVFAICIGHKTKWFGQMALITITEEFYDDTYNICHADLLFEWGPIRRREVICRD